MRLSDENANSVSPSFASSLLYDPKTSLDMGKIHDRAIEKSGDSAANPYGAVRIHPRGARASRRMQPGRPRLEHPRRSPLGPRSSPARAGVVGPTPPSITAGCGHRRPSPVGCAPGPLPRASGRVYGGARGRPPLARGGGAPAGACRNMSRFRPPLSINRYAFKHWHFRLTRLSSPLDLIQGEIFRSPPSSSRRSDTGILLGDRLPVGDLSSGATTFSLKTR